MKFHVKYHVATGSFFNVLCSVGLFEYSEASYYSSGSLLALQIVKVSSQCFLSLIVNPLTPEL